MGFAATIGIVGKPSSGPWAPALWVGYAGTFSSSYSNPNGTATFSLDSGLARACPMAAVFGRLALRPCILGEYGVLLAAGSDTVNPRSTSRPWAAIGLDARADVRLLGPLSIGADLGVTATLVTDRFVLGSDTVFYLPSVAGQATLGLGLSLP
jgi:hypothetical protein